MWSSVVNAFPDKVAAAPAYPQYAAAPVMETIAAAPAYGTQVVKMWL